MPSSETTMMDLRAQIVENLRFTHPDHKDPIVTVATHNKLWWVVVYGNDRDMLWRSTKGFSSATSALQNMFDFVSQIVWDKSKEDGIALTK
ncbi:MAG: hypothetical protein AUREO_031430 [Aureobasidium pullulans]|nr:MAG: hypothetical protein AUREO_031430 [Aureobasidium pullulans]